MFRLDRIIAFARNIILAVIPYLLGLLVLSFVVQIAHGLLSHQTLKETLFSWQFPVRWLLLVIPPILAIAVAFGLASRFVAAIHGLDKTQDGWDLIIRNRFGQTSFGPWMKIEHGKVSLNNDSIVGKVGGRGGLIVGIDNAVVLERGGQFTRVHGPGFPKLEPFEKIYDIIDLTPKRWVYPVEAMTREGVRVTWDVEIRYQIGDVEPSAKPVDSEKGAPYPASQDHVFLASVNKWIREKSWKFGQDMDWEGLVVISRTEGIVRTHLAKMSLDELVGMTNTDPRAAREVIQAELEVKLREAVASFGAQILEVRLGKLQVGDQVTRQWISFWRARWQRWSGEVLAGGEANYIRQYEAVKADTHIQMLSSIIQTLERQSAQGRLAPEGVSQLVLVRLFSTLSRAQGDPVMRGRLPSQALNTLERLRHVVGPNELPPPDNGEA